MKPLSWINPCIIKSEWASGITLYTTNVRTNEHEIKHQVTKLVLVQDSYHKNFEQYANFKCSPA
jgi:hypothetical protein